MIAAFLFLTQVSTPILPPGVSPEFSAKIFEIERLLEAAEYEKAGSALAAMPSNEIKVGWDDSAIPQEQRPALEKARDLAFETWKIFAPALNFVVATDGTLSIKLAPSTESKSAEGVLQGMTVKLDRPKADILIGMSRGNPAAASTEMNVHNDVVRAIGTYLGVGDSAFASNGMQPFHWPNAQRFALMRQDSNAAIANLGVLDALRKAATNKEKVVAAQPKLTMTESVALGPMLQGEEKPFAVELVNEGNGPLSLWVKPDCGCLTVQGIQSLAPGEKKLISAKFDSREFDGEIAKKLILVTNDPNQPVRTFNISAEVRPMYRFLSPSGPVAILDEKGGKVEVFLTFKDIEPFVIRRVDLLGLQGEVEYERWQGPLADPQRGEEAVARKGYRFVVTLPGKLPPGRSPVALSVITDSKIHPRVQYTIQAQKGIVALPDELYLGELTQAKQAKLLVSRPGKGFNVLGIDSDSPNFKASVKQSSKDEYVLEVEYDGKAPKGELNAALTVRTDDPAQPTIRVPIVATIR